MIHPYYKYLERKCPDVDADIIITVLQAFGYADAVHQAWQDEQADRADFENRRAEEEQDWRYRSVEGQ